MSVLDLIKTRRKQSVWIGATVAGLGVLGLIETFYVLGKGPFQPSSVTTKATELRIAAASDLKFVMAELIQAFEQINGKVTPKLTYGSSGNLANQLSQNAPFDLFLSADASTVEKLIQEGVAQERSQVHYAQGKLVLWVSRSSALDPTREGLKVLLHPSVRKIAIANPRHAPYGRAAEAALKATGIFDQIESKIVLGDSVAQAAQFVESGAADVGLIAMSLAFASAMQIQGKYWVVPAQLYPKLDQVAVILNQGKNSEVATAFLDFLQSDQAKQILSHFGFSGSKDSF